MACVEKEFYDSIYIGSSPLLLLDALNDSYNKNSILIIDKSKTIGGAWKNLELFNNKRVENAVHYLIFNNKCYKFIKNIMGLELKDSREKFYALKFLNIKFLIKVNNIFSYPLYQMMCIKSQLNKNIFKNLKQIIIGSNISKTFYFKYGSYSFVDKIKKAVSRSNIQLLLGNNINKIVIKDNHAYIYIENKLYVTKNLKLSHGFIPPKEFLINNKKPDLKLKKLKRPSLHIQTKINQENILFNQSFSQVIFPINSSIKYSHYLNDYFEKKNINKNKKHIVVVALNHNFKYSYKLCCSIAKELESYRLIPKKSNRKESDFYWQDILLPQLDDSDLEYLNQLSKNIIKPLLTEEISTSIGRYCDGWGNLNKNNFL